MSDELGGFTPEQARLLWQDYLARKQLHPDLAQNKPQRRAVAERNTRRLQGKLDGDLAAATAFSNSPATATMSVWAKNSSGNMVDTTRNITVTNRFEGTSLSSGTIVKAEWIDGEWQVYAADCD